MLNLLIIIGMIFTYIIMHIVFKEISLYYRKTLIQIGFGLSIITDILSILDTDLIYIILGIVIIVCAISTTCFKTWVKYITFIKLMSIFYEPLIIIIPTTTLYLIVMTIEYIQRKKTLTITLNKRKYFKI